MNNILSIPEIKIIDKIRNITSKNKIWLESYSYWNKNRYNLYNYTPDEYNFDIKVSDFSINQEASFTDKLIEKYKYIKELQNDWWEEEWSKWISKEVWKETVRVLKEIYWEEKNELEFLPEIIITPNYDWIINLLWVNSDFSILLNVYWKNRVYFDIYMKKKEKWVNWDFIDWNSFIEIAKKYANKKEWWVTRYF